MGGVDRHGRGIPGQGSAADERVAGDVVDSGDGDRAAAEDVVAGASEAGGGVSGIGTAEVECTRGGNQESAAGAGTCGAEGDGSRKDFETASGGHVVSNAAVDGGGSGVGGGFADDAVVVDGTE